ncbi:MAG: hypothetical protein KGJ59_08585 [Bacteroidota bacterium]|nr:hypothetical protein [Bacteroidota bacterium]
MIPLFVFYLLTIAAVYAFVQQYQEEGLGAGVLAVGFMILIFSIGWSICTFLLKLVIGPKGFGFLLDRDALTLLLLTMLESGFYYFFLKSYSTTKAQH